MNLQRLQIFWIATAVVIAGMVVLLSEILTPFLVGIALAYLLDPLVTRLERFGLGRGVAALGIISLFYGAIISLIVVLTPADSDEGARL
ncbi:MAG: AI-2E family transporter [Alphaproteobacteria bacterium]|nr:AI-2E family transporter [Alphaproteobacteria bacterium]